MSATMTEMQIRCGNHPTPTYHASVSDVRACCAGHRPSEMTSHPVVIHKADEPTDKQVSYLISMLASRGMKTGAEERARRMTRGEVSRWIDVVKTMPITDATIMPPVTVNSVLVESGRYAVNSEAGIKFYKVDRPTEGRWAGRTFVKVQASDDFYPIRNGAECRRILESIAVDPKAAMLLYGRELGACGHCGRTLTDETSRERGIGPVCAAKLNY
jgi:hypothetical protein